MADKFTTVRLSVGGERFEILVHPEPALDFKMGKSLALGKIIAIEEVYTDASKGLRVGTEKLNKHFATTDFLKVAEAILKKGELQVTTDQRRRFIEDKKRQIIQIISKNYIDPKTNLPHPPLRIEQALQEVRLSIDPFRSADEQSKAVVDQLRTILPLKSQKVKLMVRVPAQFASQSFGALKGFGELQKEEWGSDGGLTVTLEIPAGLQPSLLDKLGSITRGSAQASVVR